MTMKIAVIGGDGTGPEVTAEALKILDAVAKLEGFSYKTKSFDYGGDHYLRTGCRMAPWTNFANSMRCISARSGIPRCRRVF
jgi:isocitrate/isopropylmalate dehydrogenase